MPLASLDQVKRKLQLPLTFTDDDAALTAVRDAADAYVLAETGYVLANTPVQEFLQQGQLGRPFLLTRRPVTAATAQARVQGDTAWSPLALDVLDAALGLVVLPVGAAWPPGARLPRWAAWRQPTWDVVRVDYTATALAPVPADLSDAAAALAAYWYTQQRAGPLAESVVGPVQERYLDRPVPPAVEALLAPYRRREVAWQ